MSTFKGFTSVELRAPQKSRFDLTHDKRLTTRMGRLTPCLIMEAIPGDQFRISTEMLVRLAPLLAPIYDQVNVFVHYFFVPNRLLWEDWEEFITGGRLGVGIDPAEAPIPPYLLYASIDDPEAGKSSLADYLGVPQWQGGDKTDIQLHAMPFLAYQLIWSEYYRDRNYIADDVIEFPVASGSYAGIGEAVTLRTRDYLKDYFTSALPFTQRGEEVLMPLEGTGSVTYLPISQTRLANGTDPANDSVLRSLDAGTGELNFNDGANSPGRIENIDEVLLTASSVSINDFRSAYALQVWLERNAIGGSRYTESIQAHFAVKPQDSRLQRPEYIGGGRVQVQISEVLTTAWSTPGEGPVPPGNMNGHGSRYFHTPSTKYYCTEHGFIVGLLSIMNPPSYHQGLPRMFFKRGSFLDYPWPTFAKLGEQEVAKVELYFNRTNALPDAEGNVPMFAYQSRYSDWKYIPNTNHGDFHDTLLFWTLTREFEDSPVQGEDFVAFDDTTQNRIFAVTTSDDQDNFWIYLHNNVDVIRALPYFGTPNTLGF